MSTRKCKNCNQVFEKNPNRNIDYCCSYKCYTERIRKLKEQKTEKVTLTNTGPHEWEKKKMSVSKSAYKMQIRILRSVFNTYIRQRDKGKPCITCGKKLVKDYDAGHCFTVGANPELRFDPDNVHGQCRDCNGSADGKQPEHILALPGRIGLERLTALQAKINKPLKLSTPEILEKITHYKQLTKSLNKK